MVQPAERMTSEPMAKNTAGHQSRQDVAERPEVDSRAIASAHQQGKSSSQVPIGRSILASFR